MIVIFTGMDRSGSTWSYNVGRELLSRVWSVFDPESGLHLDAAEIDALVERGPVGDAPLVLKCHIPGPATVAAIRAGRVVNIYTYRDPRDATASIMRTFGTSFKNSARTVHRWLAYLARVAEASSSHGIPYPRIGAEPEAVIAEMAGVLAVDIHDGVAAQIATKLERDRLRRQAETPGPEQRFVEGLAYNPDTLLTKNHIPHAEESDWRVHLSSAEVRFSNWLWRDWLAQFGVECNGHGGLLRAPERLYYFVKLRPWEQDPFRGTAEAVRSVEQ
jgi:hypothetical protein